MTEGSCVFCKIITQKISSTLVAQNEHVVVVNDIAPKAPIHYLLIPKKHIINIGAVAQDEMIYVTESIKMVQLLSHQSPEASSFTLITNNGADAGQSVFHLHWHFIAGKNIYQDGGIDL